MLKAIISASKNTEEKLYGYAVKLIENNYFIYKITGYINENNEY